MSSRGNYFAYATSETGYGGERNGAGIEDILLVFAGPKTDPQARGRHGRLLEGLSAASHGSTIPELFAQYDVRQNRQKPAIAPANEHQR